jgi:hypothetical protein
MLVLHFYKYHNMQNTNKRDKVYKNISMKFAGPMNKKQWNQQLITKSYLLMYTCSYI